MKWILIVIGALVAVVAVIVLVGWMLPVRHRAAREATYRASPAVLFALITTVDSFPSWRPSVKRVESRPDENGHRQWREIGSNGAITFVADSVVPEERVVTRIADRSLPFGGTWTYELIPAGGTTTLRITEDGEVYNPVFRFVSRFVMGHHATIDTYLRDLAKKLGETPSVVGL